MHLFVIKTMTKIIIIIDIIERLTKCALIVQKPFQFLKKKRHFYVTLDKYI